MMRTYKTLLTASLAVALFCSARAANAQNIYGSTSIDVQQGTNTVVATCETILDEDTANFYEAVVKCTVIDSNRNLVATGGQIDHSGLGEAVTVLTLTGAPGVTYTASGRHQGEIIYGSDQPSASGDIYEFEDEYDFSSFAGESSTYYPDNYDWYGPGPETYTRQSQITAGGTTESATVRPPTYFFSTGATPTNGLCDAGSYGSFYNIAYYVADENGNRLNLSGITPLETFGNATGGFPGYASFSTPVSTTSTGSFNDVPVGTCFPVPPATEACTNVFQYFEATYAETTFPIATIVTRRDCSQGQSLTIRGNPTGQNITYTQGIVQ